ncbi:glycosyltransferase family 2 protein, partial [Methanococcoides sp. SA1]|nr:glycosyltransferase family 2 protein [Methanococcoides sp. SA1]
MQPKISIIIPIHNSEKYLKECLESIINQTLKDIEILCVVNGSTDSSLTVTKAYAAADNRITVIEKEEADLGAARNKGIRRATGEYLMFIDSDDWIKLEAC